MATPARVEGPYTAPRIDFSVTQKHIDEAVPRDSGHCMIADALKESIPNATFISVDLATIRWTDEAAGYRYIYLTPTAAQAALIEFDQGRKPEPFRIKQNAAQMHLTGSARRRRAERNAALRERGEWSPEQPELVPPPGSGTGNRAVPVKVGGSPIPGTGIGNGSAQGRSFKRREFGLRRYVR